MKSIYQLALGADFDRLQPELQDYFSLAPDAGMLGVGTGRFDVVGCPRPALRPLLKPAARENAFFPEYGTAIPFRICNYAHDDPFGRPSLSARRTISFDRRTRVFEDTSSLDSAAGLIDYIGRHRRMITDLQLQVTAAGHLRIVSARARLAVAAIPALPTFLDVKAYMEQSWDEDVGQFRVQTRVVAPLLGTIFVYAGSFDYALHPADPGIPEEAQPARWEQRT